MFEHFAQCQDTKRLPAIPLASDGHSAAECFHARETYGKNIPCREPELLSRALNGKAWSGLTTTMVAEDFLAGMVSAQEIYTQYPPFISKEIFTRCKQLALVSLGFIPSFVSTH
jgi:hypothetical protein